MPIHGNAFWFKKLPISEDDKNIFKKGSAGHMATQLSMMRSQCLGN